MQKISATYSSLVLEPSSYRDLLFSFDLLLIVLDYLQPKRRSLHRLTSTRWRSAYWGRCETIVVRGGRLEDLYPLTRLMFCLREIRFRCPLTLCNDPPSERIHRALRIDVSRQSTIERRGPRGALRELIDMACITSVYARYSALSDWDLSDATSLVELNADGNPRITTTVPFASTLRTLSARAECGIGDQGLQSAHNLRTLIADDNPHITTTLPFGAALEELSARGTCGISDAGLTTAHNIRSLFVDSNRKVTTTVPFAATLTHLYAQGSSGMGDAGLASATNLILLVASRNPRITTVAPFAASLRSLSASSNTCGIGDAGLVGAVNLDELYAVGNTKISATTEQQCLTTMQSELDDDGQEDDGETHF